MTIRHSASLKSILFLFTLRAPLLHAYSFIVMKAAHDRKCAILHFLDKSGKKAAHSFVLEQAALCKGTI